MNVSHATFRVGFGALVASMLAVLCALLYAYDLRGEWSALVMIVDGVVLGYATMAALLGGWVRSALAQRSRGASALVVAWMLLGPIPVAAFALFHSLKLFGLWSA